MEKYKTGAGQIQTDVNFFVSDKTPVPDGLHVACCVLLHFVTCVKKLIFNINHKDIYFHNFGEGVGNKE